MTLESDKIHRVYLGVDPGETTGWAIWLPSWGLRTFTHGTHDQLAFCEEMHRRFLGPASNVWSDTTDIEFVVEAFVIGPGTHKNTRQPAAIEITGFLRWLASNIGARFTLQGQSSTKNFATDEKLKALGWHAPGREARHIRDAYRQILTRASALGEPPIRRALKEYLDGQE